MDCNDFTIWPCSHGENMSNSEKLGHFGCRSLKELKGVSQGSQERHGLKKFDGGSSLKYASEFDRGRINRILLKLDT